jgi:hypothetical protein
LAVAADFFPPFFAAFFLEVFFEVVILFLLKKES